MPIPIHVRYTAPAIFNASKATDDARSSAAIPRAAATVQIVSPIATPTEASTPERWPPTSAFFVTIAVSGPGITIRSTEIARKGRSATCMAAKYAFPGRTIL